MTHAAQLGHTEVVRELLAHSTSLPTDPDADPRVAQALVSPSDTNAEALAILREAALHADTRLANGDSPKPTPQSESQDGANANLPPPEVARMIPCRFFPNCRYGDRCLFQHPTGQMMAPPQGGQPMFFPGPSGMPFSGPGPYGVPPPPFVDMNHPMFPMHYGANGMPFYPQQPMPAPDAATESGDDKAAPQTADVPTDADVDALANSMDTLGSAPDSDNAASASATRAARNASKNKNAKTTRNDSTNASQRGRTNNGSRPSCAFFARSACRYANDCRFPHILPDGTDARTLPNEDGKTKAAAPRRAQSSAAADRATDAPDSPNAASGQGKKTGQARNPRASSTNSARGKGARRGAAPTHAGRKTVQRVPNSDEFPALPGGARPESSDATPNESDAETKPATKANFSAILSAPAPPKAPKAKSPEREEALAPAAAPAAEAPAPAAESPATPSQESNVPAPSSPASRDFAAVAASSQPNAVSA